MKISIICASHRTNSQSKKISDILHNNLLKIKSDLDMYDLDLADKSLPLWSPDKKNGKGIWGDTWNSISDNLIKSLKIILLPSNLQFFSKLYIFFDSLIKANASVFLLYFFFNNFLSKL